MQFPSRTLSFDQPHIMGILNVTPDSFSDGGKHQQIDLAIRHALAMVAQGATFIDIGGESTRPGAPEVGVQEELDRVIPAIEAISRETNVIISVDTSKAKVMQEAVAAGAELINDVRALQEPGAIEVASNAAVPVCLMHMQGQPRTMQQTPEYDDVTQDVIAFLQQRIEACKKAGISTDKLILDPGYGFGKALEHNYQLLNGLPNVLNLGYPVLVGMSRKSMIGQLLNRPVNERLAGSIALATIAAQMGAQIIRVHDVQETADAVAIVNKLKALQ
ncbi:dihydropteroate synthase [Alteromonas sp. H39]|uniref:dihydropteroate synthase n=1 Tax=Alteromonas sp. H39 TaxID=3389876 RepID=UPI0039E06B16